MLHRLRRSAPLMLTATLWLAACAQPPLAKYEAPPSGPTAKLAIRSTLQPGERYGIYLADSANDCQGMRLAASGSKQGGDPAPVTISAVGVRTVEVFLSLADRSTCRARWSFYPAPGRSYLVTTKNGPEGCAAMIFDATEGDAMRIEPSLLRRDVPGNLCMPLAQSKSIGQLVAQPATGKNTPPKAGAAQLPSRVVDDDLKGLIRR